MRVVAAALVAVSLGAAAQLPEPVRAALTRAQVPLNAASVVVMPVAEGAALVEHEARTPMNPASVMKLFTTYAALELLGPAFTFHTDFLVRGTIADGVLDGDLVVRGGADPKLTYDSLWRALHALRSRGVRDIRGDIVVDRSYFAPAVHDPARFDNEPRRAYNVGTDAFLVNFQAVNFTVIPGKASARVVAEPDFPNLQIQTRIALTKEPCGDFRRALKVEFDDSGLIGTVSISGNYAAACGEKSFPFALFDGPRYSESALRWLWSESGGVLRGKVRTGPVPPEAVLLYRHDSEPLANLVREMNKFSNNVMARQIYLALSAERGGTGEAKASERVMREWLATRGIEAPELSIENGAGLSRADRASAMTIARLLRSVWSSALMPEIMSSLPLYAVDGTFKTRKVNGAGGHAHLKGGTLTGVQSVAGYVLDAHGRRWILVMTLNHANANGAQGAIDAMVEWVQKQ